MLLYPEHLCNRSTTMATPSATFGGFDKKRIDLTPITNRVTDSEISFAPKKRKPESLVRFLQNVVDAEEYEWSLSDGRVGGYVFDKEECCVKLYTVDTDCEALTDDALHLSFSAKDWKLFRNKVWRDLEVPGLNSVYSAVWDSTTHQRCYYVFVNSFERDPQDYIYMCCGEYTIVNDRFEIDVEKVIQDLKVMYPWKDAHALHNVFKKIDRLFNWSELLDRYRDIKVRLFQTCASDPKCDCGALHLESPPLIYKH